MVLIVLSEIGVLFWVFFLWYILSIILWIFVKIFIFGFVFFGGLVVF